MCSHHALRVVIPRTAEAAATAEWLETFLETYLIQSY